MARLSHVVGAGWMALTRHKGVAVAVLVVICLFAIGAQAFQLRATSRVAPPCGVWPTPGSDGAPSPAPTPLKASPPAGGAPAHVGGVAAVVGSWTTCFRPAVVTIRTGSLVQWQDADAPGQGVVLDNGTDLGVVRHVLEVRFNLPGAYRYHGKRDAGATGTVIVQGNAVPGPPVEVTLRPSQAGKDLAPPDVSPAYLGLVIQTADLRRFEKAG